MRQKEVKGLGILVLVLVALASISFMFMVVAEPDGASVTYVSNTTKAAASPGSRNDSKGTITTLTISTVQQNIKWKAYVGNVSGTLVLRDAEDFAIYQWPSGGSPDGEVYITRNESIDWSTIQCANQTDIVTEQNLLGHTNSSSDNINNTFSNQIHESIDIGVLTINESTCYSTATWVNNTAQTLTTSSLFQEVLLMDSTQAIVYAALIDQDASSFRSDQDNSTADSNVTYDFQAIVPDYTGAAQAVYYFYVEIDG